MRIAIIDLGTNTFNILIVNTLPGGSYNTIYRDRFVAKIGKGGFDKKIITKEAFERGLKGIQYHYDNIKKYNVDKIICYATSAIRDALNGNDFVKKVKDKFNIEIQVIDGQKEAELIFDGVKQVTPIDNNTALIMDIGGGSTEFIIANRKGIINKYSFNLGAARIIEITNPNDPITKNNIIDIENLIYKEITPLLNELKKHNVTSLIGSSGTFDTLAEMIKIESHPNIDLNLLSSYQVNINDFYKLYQKFITFDYEKRSAMKGMDKARVDLIVVASVFINYIIEKLNIKTIIQSCFALKEGAVLQEIKKLQ